MSQSLLLRGARQLLTLRGEPSVRRGPQKGNLEVIEDGSVFIQGGKIVSVGTTRRLENLKETRGALDIPARNCVVMPGFVDPFIQVSLLTKDGKRRKLRDFYSDCLALMRSCLSYGTLNAGIKSSSRLASMGADMLVLRQLARIGDSPVGMARTWLPDKRVVPNEQTLTGALQTVVKRGLADFVEWSGTADPAFGEPLISAVHQAGLNVSLDWLGGSAQDLHDLLERSQAASAFCHHNLSPAERAVLVQTRSIAIFKAGGTLLDSEPECRVRQLLDEGGAVALGSGYDTLYEPNFNMQLVLALAVRRMGLTIEEAITATTINAAYAMNWGSQLGSLEPGKRADLLVLNLSDYRDIPHSRLGVNHVALSIRNGEIVANRTKWKVSAR